MEITRIIWLEDIVEKLLWKHDVKENEVVEVLENRPKFQYKEAGHRYGEDVFAAFGQTDAGRLSSIKRLVCVHSGQTCDYCFSKRHDTKRKE